MRVLVLTGLSLAVLAACSQTSDREVLAETCVDSGEARETCECIAGAMEAELSPDLMKRTAAAVGREQRDVEDFVASLTIDEQLEFAGALGEMASCKLSTAEEEDG